MTRAEIEKVAEPIIRKCLREFGDYTKNEMSDEDFERTTVGMFRPDVRRVSLIISMAQSILGASVTGEGLEVGSGYAYLLFPVALLLPNIRWFAVDHPGRAYLSREEFIAGLHEYRCEFAGVDITREPLPFADARFMVLTFSEVLEHLPPERLNFVLSELARVLRPGGILLMSSPSQTSLENRVRLLRGKSILAMPDEEVSPRGKLEGMFGHIRLYTTSEMETVMLKLGFSLERCTIESNSSGYVRTPRSLRKRLYRLFEFLEERLEILRPLGDTWYMAWRKNVS